MKEYINKVRSNPEKKAKERDQQMNYKKNKRKNTDYLQKEHE